MELGGFISETSEPQQPPFSSSNGPIETHQSNSIPSQGAISSEGCSQCSNLSVDRQWLDAFGVPLCFQCRKGHKLVSKTAAREIYYVTEGELKKLGCLRRTNPRRKDWQPMCLYLESQVQDLAYKKFGGPEGIEIHRKKMFDDKVLSRIRKREEDRKKDLQKVATLKAVKRRIENERHSLRLAESDVDCDIEQI